MTSENVSGNIFKCYYKVNYASVAQSVEQRIRNAQVAGSSPAGSSTKNGYLRGIRSDCRQIPLASESC